MKPRNKLHHRIVDLSQYLFPISKQQKEWAKTECLEHRGYATKNRVLCLDCGETFSPQLVSRKKAVCPHCNTKLDVKESRCTTDRQVNYFAITEIFNEFQIVRNFEIIANYKKGSSADIYIHEILQYWIQPDLKVTMFGKKHNLNYCCDSWGGNMEIREDARYSYHGKKYDVYARKYHPDSVIKPEYKMHGIDTNLQQVTFLDAIKHIPNHPKLETLLKAKQYWLVDAHINQSGRSINYYWDSIKICLRNRYKVKDAGLWMDYMDLLHYFNKDRRNAQFVCPKDLKKVHDNLVAKKRIIQKRREIEEQKRTAEKDNKFYLEEKSKFFDLQFTNGPLVIIPLKSVQEFIEEGDKLKHCVFTNRYFAKKESLVLSARINNEPIETIEIDLEKLKITQARGLKNEPTEHHDKILELVKNNISKIAEIVQPKKRKKSKKLVESI
jgi:DNA-directed RNA polymerase subunit RPC12/RpoP